MSFVSSSSRSLMASTSCARCPITITRSGSRFGRRFDSPIHSAGPSRSLNSTGTRASTSTRRTDSTTNTNTNTNAKTDGNRDLEGQEEEDAPKINTWFLNSTPTPSSVRQPQFTTYDSQSTLPLPATSTPSSSSTIKSLPRNASASLRSIYEFLISEESVASDVLIKESISVFDTLLLNKDIQGEIPPSPSQLDLEESESGSDEMIPVEGVWRWIIVLQVKGRGRGVVARADGVIRRWLVQNPLGTSRHPSSTATANPKLPRIDPDADWSIVPLPREGICINVLTEQGRERWRLEDVWQPRA